MNQAASHGKDALLLSERGMEHAMLSWTLCLCPGGTGGSQSKCQGLSVV